MSGKKLQEEGPAQEAPVNMGQLITKAEMDWQAGRKDEAFHTVLAAMVLLSKGVAKCLTHVNEADARVSQPKNQKE